MCALDWHSVFCVLDAESVQIRYCFSNCSRFRRYGHPQMPDRWAVRSDDRPYGRHPSLLPR